MLRRSSSGVEIGGVSGLVVGLRRSSSLSSSIGRGGSNGGSTRTLPAALLPSLPRRLSESTPSMRRLLQGDAALSSIPEAGRTPVGATIQQPVGSRKSLILMCLMSAIDGMDIQLLPASFRALESDLGLRPTNLALLAVCQGYAMCVSGPLWASIADHGFPRKWLLAAGSAMWGTLTLLLAMASSFHTMIVLRTLNGVALGLLTPVIQSLVVEVSTRNDIGFSFGCIDFCHMAIGQALALVAISAVADKEAFGLAGWRVAFIAVALMSIAMAIPIILCIEEKPRPWRPDGVGLLSEFRKFAGYMRMPTFVVLIAQGVFGTVPGSAMAFTTMYFQYVGVGSLSGVVAAFKIVGTGIGSVIGGAVGDRLAAAFPLHGRVLTAQLSVALCLPVALAVFLVVPPREDLWPLHTALLFCLGLLHWCSSGCNRPLLVDLVSTDCVGSVVAWQNCIEHLSGFILGPMGVALLSESLFSYVPEKKPVAWMSAWDREVNAAALGKSLALCTAVPWAICFMTYGLLHATYPRDLCMRVLKEGQMGAAPSSSGRAVAGRPAGLGKP